MFIGGIFHSQLLSHMLPFCPPHCTLKHNSIVQYYSEAGQDIAYELDTPVWVIKRTHSYVHILFTDVCVCVYTTHNT